MNTSSICASNFYRNNYTVLKTLNPAFPILLREGTGTGPYLLATYGGSLVLSDVSTLAFTHQMCWAQGGWLWKVERLSETAVECLVIARVYQLALRLVGFMWVLVHIYLFVLLRRSALTQCYYPQFFYPNFGRRA